MANFTYPDISEVELPETANVYLSWISHFDTQDEADQFLQSILDQTGSEIMEGNGVYVGDTANGPLWDKIVLYTQYVENRIRLAVHRVLYWLVS